MYPPSLRNYEQNMCQHASPGIGLAVIGGQAKKQTEQRFLEGFQKSPMPGPSPD